VTRTAVCDFRENDFSFPHCFVMHYVVRRFSASSLPPFDQC